MYKYTHDTRVRCSFCGKLGHNVRSCKEVILAANDTDNVTYDKGQVATAKAHIQKRNEKAKSNTNQRNKPRCGFCRSVKHNRKNCRRMKTFRRKVYKANKNWRAIFSERIGVLGVGEGALIEANNVPVNVLAKFSVKDRRPKHVGIINPFDSDSLNVFCNFAGSYDYRSNADVTAKIITQGGMVDISIGKFVGEDLFHKNAFFSHWSRIKVINRKQIEFSKAWMAEKSIPVLDWLSQTHSYEDLETLGIVRFIEDWTKNVLDNSDE